MWKDPPLSSSTQAPAIALIRIPVCSYLFISFPTAASINLFIH